MIGLLIVAGVRGLRPAPKPRGLARSACTPSDGPPGGGRSRASAASRPGCWSRSARRPIVAAHNLGTGLPEPAAAGRLPRGCRDHRRALVRVRARAGHAGGPDAAGPRRPRPGRAPDRPAGRRPDRLGLDRRPGHRRRDLGGVRRDAVPVGLRVGRRRRSCPRCSRRCGSGSTRSRRSTTCSPGRCGRSASAAGASPSSRPSCGCGRRWSGSMFFIWLELVAIAGNGTLTVVLVGYTVLTLALMAQFGRDQWLAAGETFTVWFRTLNRLAIYGIVPAATTAEARGVDGGRRGSRCARPVGGPRGGRSRAASSTRPGRSRGVALVALGTASIIFDGLSQTVAFATLFGNPALVQKTVLLIVFLWVDRGHRAGRRPGRQLGRHRRGPHADRRRLPRRPLPDLPADRRPADHRRRLRPAADRRGPDRHRVLHSRRRSWRPASSGPCSSRRSSAATCSARGRAT